MPMGVRPGGAGQRSELIVRDCGACGRPTVFAQEPAEAAVCAGCAGGSGVQRESTRSCPVDGTPLAPEHRSGIALDRCPSCEGIWLDADELDLVIRAASSLTSGRSDRVANLLVDVFVGDSDKAKSGK